ncbi:MAG: glycine--tRNA ligase subunit beta [bacterium]|nr:glycine--tRNA ligase subunit beta [bacterium]
MTVEYLLETRFQEMPRRFLDKIVRQLATRLFEDLMGRGLGPAELLTGVTPRRVMVCLKGLPEIEPDREEQELGPAVAEAYDADGAPTDALRGFAERVGAAPEDLEQTRTERGTYLALTRRVAGRPVAEVLAELVPRVLAELRWWLPARASSGAPSGILSVLGGEALPFGSGGATVGPTTVGHPVQSPGAFEVTGLDDYLAGLRERGILVDSEARRAAFSSALEGRAAELGGGLVDDAELLDRLTSVIEVPGVVHGAFDPDHLKMPEEVILAALARRAGAFAVRGEDGALLPSFLTAMDRPDDPAGLVRAGQEKAVAGRLIDARFRCDTDRRLTLAERVRRLEEIDFHPRLGSYAAKGERVRALAELACGELGWQDELDTARDAAELLKADLTSGIVLDFPSLRGTIGGIYAREEGYIETVWQAIYEHYQHDPIPRDRCGRVVAVADRLDSLVGLFGARQAPSGSKDPYALRRLTRGLLRIVVGAEMELDLDLMTARAVLLYGERLSGSAEGLLRELQGFLAERVRHFLGRQGFAHDEIEAAEAVGAKNLPDLVARLRALRAVRGEAEFRSLVLAAKRLFNIVRDSPEYDLHTAELAEGAEQDLHHALGGVRDEVDRAAGERRYEDCLRSMAKLVPHLDRFFSGVLVMDENESLRNNRVALLQACRRVFWRIGRLKEMAVDRGENRVDGALPL